MKKRFVESLQPAAILDAFHVSVRYRFVSAFPQFDPVELCELAADLKMLNLVVDFFCIALQKIFLFA